MMFARTKRLTLRPGWPEDADALTRAIAHETVVTKLSRAPWPYEVDDAHTFLSLPRGANEPRFQIVAHDGFRLIGGIGLTREAHGDHELGYWLTPDAWGRGYATEAGRAVLDMGRYALGLRRFVARHYADNPASGHVLRKLGFRETGRSTLYSLGRGREADSIEFTLELDGDRTGDMPIAA